MSALCIDSRRCRMNCRPCSAKSLVIDRNRLGHATLLSGTVTVTAEGQSFQLQERDALRFAADSAYRFENRFNSTARILLVYQYLK